MADLAVYVTKCCKHRFIGKNHSPEWKGECRNCGKLWEGTITCPHCGSKHVNEKINSWVCQDCVKCWGK